MYGIHETNIDYSQSALREEYGKFVVQHGRQRPITRHTSARARAQHLWVRKRLMEDKGIDVSDLSSYHVTLTPDHTIIFLGR